MIGTFVDKQMSPVSDGQVTVGDQQPGEGMGNTGTWWQEGRTANQWFPAREDLASKNSSMMSAPEQRLLWLQEQKFLVWNSIGGFVTNTSHDKTY